MATVNERTIARLGDKLELQALKEAVLNRIEADVQELARKSYKLPSTHDPLEWVRLRARHDGMLDIFKFVERAQAAVKAAEAQRKE